MQSRKSAAIDFPLVGTAALNLSGTNGNDLIWGTSGSDYIFGLEGDDGIVGWEGDDVLYGDGGNDSLYGERGNDRLYGGANNDTLRGGEGNNILDGGSGIDTVNYDEALTGVSLWLYENYARTGFSTDNLVSIENVWGTQFGDYIWADDNNNVLNGWLGDDQIEGRGGNDRIIGGEGRDVLYGGAGNDVLIGDAVINGGGGIEVIVGDGAFDTLYGGSGGDQFMFSTLARGGNLVGDFSRGLDSIILTSNGFANPFGSDGRLARGTFNSSGFFHGENMNSGDNHDRFYFNTATHSLWRVDYGEWVINSFWGPRTEYKIDLANSFEIARFANGVEITRDDIFFAA